MITYSLNTLSEASLLSFLRTASPDHSPALTSVVNLQEYATKIHNNGIVFEAWDEEKLCGILAGYFNNPNLHESFITMLHVDRKYRRFGIGRNLLVLAIRFAREKKFHKIALMVNLNNQTAIDFYIKNKFVSLYTTETQVRMEREL